MPGPTLAIREQCPIATPGNDGLMSAAQAAKLESLTPMGPGVTEVNTGPGLTGGPITSTGTIEIASSGVAPGAYTNANITVGADGRVTAAASGAPSGGVTELAAAAGIALTPNPITGTGTIGIAPTAVVPGDYTRANITVGADGRITAAGNGAPDGVTQIIAGSGITCTPDPIVGTGTIGIAPTAVAPGAYTNANITVGADGRITSASSGTAGPAPYDSNPADLGVSAPGNAIEYARGNHVHAHGAQAGGALHANATGATAGFMSAADKTKLDGIVAGDTVWTPVTLLNGWSDVNADTWGVAACMKDAAGNVHMRGLIYLGFGIQIAVLPVGYRPSKQMNLIGYKTTGSGNYAITVYPDGTVTTGEVSVTISLADVQFNVL